MPRKPNKDDDEESAGSLKDFIVDDSDEESVDDESDHDEGDDEESDDESEDSDDCTEETSEESTESADKVENNCGTNAANEERPSKRRRHDESQDLQLMQEEAARFAANVSGTVVGGRTLRSRAPEQVESRRPRDAYYEKYGKHEEAKLMEKFTKKDIIEFLARLAAEGYKDAYEAAGNSWPILNVKMSLDDIRSEYDKVKAFLNLPESDDEESDDEDEETDDDDDDEMDDDGEEDDDV